MHPTPSSPPASHAASPRRGGALAAALALAAAMVCVSAPAGRAETAAAPLAAARTALSEGRTEDARRVLGALDPREVRDPAAYHFLSGLAALAVGDLPAAAAAFERALIERPDAPRIRLELARAYYLLRDDDNARRQFEIVLAGDPPEGVRRRIAAYLRRIDQRRNWSAEISVAIAPDTNVNSASDVEQVEVFGLPFTVDEDARARSGLGLETTAAFEAFLPFDAGAARQGRDDLFLRLVGLARDYANAEFDDHSAQISIGVRRAGPRGFWEAAPALRRRWTGNRRDSDRVSLEMRGERALGGGVVALGSARIGREHRRGRRHDQLEASVGARRAVAAQALLTLRLSGFRSVAAFAVDSYHAVSLGAELYVELPYGFTATTSPSVTYVRFDDEDPFFETRRIDWSVGAGFEIANRRIRYGGFTPTLSYRYVAVDSTVPLSEFDRHRVTIGATRRF